MNPRRAWILPNSRADGSSFFMWSERVADWIHESRLIPISASQTAGARGQATFRLLRTRKAEPGQRATQVVANQMTRGQYIAVCAAADVDGRPVFDWSKVEWVGTIDTFDAGIIPGADPSTDGQVIANGVGIILDSTIPRGWVMSDGTTGTEIQTPQPFNIKGDNGVIIGNREGAVSPGGAFAALRSQCGTTSALFWTRKQVAEFALGRCRPPGLGSMTLVADTNVTTFISDTSAPESWDLAGQSFGQILDTIFPRSYGISWTVRVNASGLWEIVVYALLYEGEAGVPVGTPVDANLDAATVTAQPRIVYDSASVYDEVNVIGGPVIWCGSIAAKDRWLDKGWSASAETAYKTAASTMLDYATLALSKQAERNAQARGGAALSAVFSRLIVGPGTNSGAMKTSATPGVGTPTLNFFPLIQWDGTTATTSATLSADPPWPTAMIERTIPWERGTKADGTSLGLSDDDATPSYLPPLAFARIQTRDTSALEPLWYDLSQEFGRRPGFGLDVDDRTAAIRLVATPAEWLAKGDWTGMATSSLAPGATTETEVRARLSPIIDWRDVVATVALASAQRIEVRKLRSGSTDGLARKVLRIEMPELQSWWVRQGSIVGMKPKTTTTDQLEPDIVATDTQTRNDWPTAERIARLASAYAFAERATLSVELGNIDTLPAWAAVGTMIGNVIDGGASADISTTVEEVTYRWMEGRVTVRTDLPPAPAWMSRINQAASPQLGGSMASSVLDLQKRVDRAEEKTQNVPIVPQKPSPSAQLGEISYVMVDGGQTLITFSGTNYLGVKSSSSAVTSLPAVLPTPGTTYADGVGYGRILDANGVPGGYRWVLNGYSGAGPGIPLPQGHVSISTMTVRIPYPTSSDTTIATAYIIWR